MEEVIRSSIKKKMPSPRYWFCGIICLILSFALVFTGDISFSKSFPVQTFLYSLFVPFALDFFERKTHPISTRGKWFASLFSLLISQFITIGTSFFHTNTWYLCFGNIHFILIWILQSLCYGYICYNVTIGLFCILEHHSQTVHSTINLKKWCIYIIFVKLIFLFAFYPCIFDFDAACGLHTLLDSSCANCNHHPFFIQLLHGAAFLIGKSIGHISIGFALLSVFLILVSTSIIVYGLSLLQKAGLSAKYLIAVATFYCFAPIFPYLSVYPTKDGIFAYFFLLYIFTIFEIISSNGKCFNSKRIFLLHGIAALLVCLSRHQGIYFVIIESFILLIYKYRLWQKILIAILPSIFIWIGFENIILPHFNVEPSGKQELYGTLFQQTALYVKKYPTKVTPTEKAAINSILNIETIAEKYNPRVTDAVKNGYHYNPWYRESPKSVSMFRHISHEGEREALHEYKLVWWNMLLKHPLCYIEATTAVCIGYFYNLNHPMVDTYTRWATNANATTKEYRFWHVDAISEIYFKIKGFLARTPVLSWVCSIPYYNWITIFLFFLLLYRKDYSGIVIFLPVLFSLGILLICPMVHGRYIFPIVISLPFLFSYFLINKSSE